MSSQLILEDLLSYLESMDFPNCCNERSQVVESINALKVNHTEENEANAMEALADLIRELQGNQFTRSDHIQCLRRMMTVIGLLDQEGFEQRIKKNMVKLSKALKAQANSA